MVTQLMLCSPMLMSTPEPLQTLIRRDVYRLQTITGRPMLAHTTIYYIEITAEILVAMWFMKEHAMSNFEQRQVTWFMKEHATELQHQKKTYSHDDAL